MYISVLILTSRPGIRSDIANRYILLHSMYILPRNFPAWTVRVLIGNVSATYNERFTDSTPLSMALADQGVKIRIRKDIRVRKRHRPGVPLPMGAAAPFASAGSRQQLITSTSDAPSGSNAESENNKSSVDNTNNRESGSQKASTPGSSQLPLPSIPNLPTLQALQKLPPPTVGGEGMYAGAQPVGFHCCPYIFALILRLLGSFERTTSLAAVHYSTTVPIRRSRLPLSTVRTLRSDVWQPTASWYALRLWTSHASLSSRPSTSYAALPRKRSTSSTKIR
jgi:hypothetical protein